MVPVAIEGCAQGAEGGGARGGSISLATLIDFIVQRTYHELTVLAELLPRKTDMERKVEIYKFSARTRQLFVRLLALVKWASSATKVDRSAHIMAFLDKQALLFVKTADVLASVARETLVHARLPTFHMAAAVEVLTLGTYSRLPAVIRERLVPPAPLTPAERRTTLRALAHVVRQRLTTAALPPDVRNLKVENGRAAFTVGQEFSVSLTVMGDAPNLPWRLLDIAILIQDSETGEGKPLVHPTQLAWLKGVAQARLAAGGLSAALTALRFFCRALSLELLYTQTLRLCRDRLSKHLQVDRYTPGQRLQVSYWRQLGCELGYRLCVEAAETGALAVSHVPALAGGARVAAALHAHAPSMERLLAHTVHARSRARLAELRTLLADMGVECTLGGWPCVLSCSPLSPCQRAEQLLVGVGAHGGALRCRVPQHAHAPHMAEMAAALAMHHRERIAALLTELRYWLVARRCEKTLQHLPASASERLPFLHGPSHPLAKLAPHRLYVTLHRHANHVLVVEMKETTTASVGGAATAPATCGVGLSFHLAGVRRCGPDQCEGDGGGEDTTGPKAFVRVLSLVELDTFAVTHGPFTPLDTVGMVPGKRKLSGAIPGARSVRARQPAYFLPELAHVVAAADERVPFVHLTQELSARGVAHGGLQAESCGASLALRLVWLPAPQGACPRALPALRRRLLAATLRLALRNQARVWTAEIAFHASPVHTTHPKEQGPRRCVYLQYELGAEGGAARTAEAFLADWASIVHLHSLVYHYMQRPQSERDTLSGGITIRSYNYRTLTLGCGPGGRATCAISWASGRYRLTLGAQHGAVNAHALLHHQLETHVNWFKDLLALGVVLRETYAPLVALARLPTTPQLGLQHGRPQVPIPTFTLLPHSWRKIRISYAGAYCLEVGVRGGGLVAVRDGAYSRFDRSAVVEEFGPTQGLKAFLSRYVDETAVSRGGGGAAGLLSEDDNPPSPVSPATAPGGSGLRFSAPMTPPAGPHTPHSQPVTPHPASPAQHQHGSFNLTSPPGGAPASPLAPSPLAGASPAHPPPTSPFPPWPASPSLPRVSPAAAVARALPDHKGSTGACGRVLVGGRAWAGATATLLSAAALEALCAPSEAPPGAPPGPALAPLERFLGAVYMRRHLQRFIQQEEPLTMVACGEPGVVMFRAETAGLSGRVALHPQHMQSLHLQLTPLPEHKDAWSSDDLQVMEKFFDTRVAVPPFRPTALWGWGRLVAAPAAALRDVVALMRAELVPPPGAAWAPAWALRIPPAAPPIVPATQPAVLLARSKILFFLSLTRGETQLVLPLVYDVATNHTQLAEKRDPGHHAPPPHMHAVTQHLKRFSEFSAVHGECSLWPAVRDLLTNLQLPQDTTAAPQQSSS